MRPNRTRAAESILASTGRRMAVSESFIALASSEDRSSRVCCNYVENKYGISTFCGPDCVRTGPRTYPEARTAARSTDEVCVGLENVAAVAKFPVRQRNGGQSLLTPVVTVTCRPQLPQPDTHPQMKRDQVGAGTGRRHDHATIRLLDHASRRDIGDFAIGQVAGAEIERHRVAAPAQNQGDTTTTLHRRRPIIVIGPIGEPGAAAPAEVERRRSREVAHAEGTEAVELHRAPGTEGDLRSQPDRGDCIGSRQTEGIVRQGDDRMIVPVHEIGPVEPDGDRAAPSHVEGAEDVDASRDVDVALKVSHRPGHNDVDARAADVPHFAQAVMLRRERGGKHCREQQPAGLGHRPMPRGSRPGKGNRCATLRGARFGAAISPCDHSRGQMPISYEDFAKVEMRVGRIVQVDDFPQARKPAWKLRIDFGSLGVKTSSAQITKYYAKEELLGKLE